MTDERPAPDLSFVIPAANENRWSDLLATLISTDPQPIARLIGASPDTIRREVVVPGHEGRKSDRLDLLLLSNGHQVAAIEVKLLADLGPQQLQRYQAAFPDAGAYLVLHLRNLPVNLRVAPGWKSLTWESVLEAYSESPHPWAAATARAWLTQLGALIPHVDTGTVWNDVPDDPASFELALRACIAWLARQMDSWCDLEHDVAPSSGGGNWSVRMWARSAADPEHLVTAEVQEGLTAYEWRADPQRPYRGRLPGPVALVGLRQEGVATSAGFDWGLLYQTFTTHVLDEDGEPRDNRAWHTTTARPTDPVDKQHWQTIVQAGAPRWLGKGWGMKVAQSTQSCLFGARFAIEPTKTLGETDAELRHLQTLIADMASA